MLPVFIAFGFGNRWWRYVSTQDMWGVLRGVAAAVIAAYLVFTLLDFHPASIPRGIWIVDLLLLLAFVMGGLLARTLIERPSALDRRPRQGGHRRRGDAAQLMLRELLNPAVGYTPIGLVDDDPRKKNLRLHGVRVLGTTAELPALLRDRRPDELLIAIPSASGDVRERIVAVARAAGVPVKTLPGLHELITGDFNLAGQIRPVEVEDLLGREPVDVDLPGDRRLPGGRGRARHGCRRLDRGALPPDRAHAPTRLVLVDNSEPGLFEIEQDFVDEREFHATAAVLGDAGNAAKMAGLREVPPDRRVPARGVQARRPLVEANPLEAATPRS